MRDRQAERISKKRNIYSREKIEENDREKEEAAQSQPASHATIRQT